MSNKLMYALSVVVLLGCGVKNVPADVNQIAYPGQFVAEAPSPRWRRMENCRELALYAPQLVNIYLKKDTGSVILVRFGRRSEYGVPIEYELTKPELIYLTKFLPKGSFEGVEEFKSSNPLLERADRMYRYRVEHKALGPGRMVALAISRGGVLLVEFFAPQGAVEEDEAEFFKFLDNLKERKK